MLHKGVRARQAFAVTIRLGLALALGLGMISCAKSPTVVLATVTADITVAPLLVVTATVVSQTTGKRWSNSYVSQARGDGGGRPAPFNLPLQLALQVRADVAGPVSVTIESINWDTNTVIARGTSTAEVTAEQQTLAAVMLTAVAPPEMTGADGGTGLDGGVDGREDARSDAGRDSGTGDGLDGATEL